MCVGFGKGAGPVSLRLGGLGTVLTPFILLQAAGCALGFPAAALHLHQAHSAGGGWRGDRLEKPCVPVDET